MRKGASITALGAAVPEGVVTSAAIAARLGVSEEWIVTRTGVRERRIAGDADTVLSLASAAGRQALHRGGVDARDVGMVIVATMAADDLTPNAAPLVAEELGATDAAALDVGAACSGFLTSLSLAAAQIESGRAERVLVIGADLLSRLTDPTDRGTAALFADGAGAVLVDAVDGTGGIGPILMRADGDTERYVHASHTERRIRMRGHETFREAVRRISESTLDVLDKGDVRVGDVDLFVYHQANRRILEAVGERLGLRPERVVDCVDRFGNTSSGSIPLALADAQSRGLLRTGHRVLLGTFGAGLTWGAGLVSWQAAAPVPAELAAAATVAPS